MAGDSMLPSLREGDVLLCRPARNRVERGDVVVFPHPKRPWLRLVKRVVGLAGETVAIQMGEVIIDGQPALDGWGQGLTFPDGAWKVPRGHAFVLSDNRLATRDDSRHFGPVPVGDLARVWWQVRVGGGASPGRKRGPSQSQG